MFFQRPRLMFVSVFLLATFLSVMGIFLLKQSIAVHASNAGESIKKLSSQNAHVQPGISLYSVSNGLAGQSNPGGHIRVSGSGFHARERVNIYFQIQKNGVTTVTTDRSGSLNTTITVPMHSSSPATTYYVYAKNSAGMESARAKFTYTTPSVSFLNEYGPDASSGALFVNGFGANEKIQIINHYQQPNHGNLLTITANANGSMETRITWPSSAHTNNNHTNTVPFAAVGNTTKLTAKNTYLLTPILLTTTTDEVDATGKAGDTVKFNGKNFAAGEKISLAFNAKIVFTGISHNDGSFTASIVVPPLQNVSNGAGNVQVKATGATSGLSVGLYYPDRVTFYYQPTLIVTPTSGPSGTTITVIGTHFSASVSLPIGWDGPFNPNPQLSGYPAGTYELVNTDQNGNFTATIQADNLVSGQIYHVTVSNSSTDPNLLTTATFVAQ